jgi:hypothetical protein
MFSKLHNKLGTAGLIVAIIALIAAFSGAALAKGVIITKLSQISPKVQKKLKGKAGPQGATGPQGPAGAAGPAGAPGPAGNDGVEGPRGPQGIQGEPGPMETKLPAGKTMKGLWEFVGNQAPAGLGLMTISFPLRVEPEPHFEWVPVDTAEGENEHCPGQADVPKAEPGYLCVYANVVLGTTAEKPDEYAAPPTLGWRGAWGIEGEAAIAYGSWAVTAAE